MSFDPEIIQVRDVYRRIWAQLDPVVEQRMQTFNASCRMGCSHCCHQLFSASWPEALAAAATLTLDHPDEVARIRGRLLLDVFSIAQIKNDAITRWMRRGLPCALLKDNLCLVYRDRPAVCRAHAVVTPPERCDPASPDAVVRLLNMEDVVLQATHALIEAVQSTRSMRVVTPFPVALHFALTYLCDGEAAFRRAVRRGGDGPRSPFFRAWDSRDWWGGRPHKAVVESGMMAALPPGFVSIDV